MTMSNLTPTDAIQLAKDNNIQIVDLKFTDLPGTLQHFSVPLSQLDENSFVEGLGFDGSSIRGFQPINESDMMLVPDATTAVVDSVLKVPTLSFVCDVRDPITEGPYSRDPRYVAQKAEDHLKSTGIADISYWGPELEHFIFDDVRYEQNEHSGYYFVDSEEGIWNSGLDGADPNLGHRPRYKQGYFPTPPTDSLQDVRSEMVLKMIDYGIDIEVHHHEVGTAGQGEIDMRYRSLTRMADQVMLHKYIVKNVAHSYGKTATFMPKPLFGDNGSGMHTHQSLWKDGTPLFYDSQGYALMSQMGLYYIGGLLKHSPGAARLLRAHDELVPPAGAGVRGAGQLGVLTAKPQRLLPYPRLHQGSGGQES